MRLLLDTHIFFWYVTQNAALPDHHCEEIGDANNDVYLSVASLWEAAVKYHLGKWPMPQPTEIFFPQEMRRHNIISLPLDEASVIEAVRLPLLHKDPFDRMLIGQAAAHRLTLVTADSAIRAYPNVSLL